MIVVPFSAGQSMSPTSIRAVYCRRLAILRASLEASEAAIRALLWRIAGRIPRFSREVRGRSGRFSGEPSPNYASNFNVLAAVLQSIDSLQQDADTQRRPEAAKDTQKAGSARACALLQPAAWGVKPKARPAGQTDDSCCTGDREDRRRRRRRIGAAAARERTAMRSALREAVPNEVQAGSAGAPARVPRAMRAAVRRDGRIRRCTHAQHGAAARDAAANAPAIGEAGACRAKRGNERGAKRARGLCRRATDVRKKKRAAPPPPVAGDDDAARLCAAVRPRCAGPGCRAAAPCRRGSR